MFSFFFCALQGNHLRPGNKGGVAVLFTLVPWPQVVRLLSKKNSVRSFFFVRTLFGRRTLVRPAAIFLGNC